METSKHSRAISLFDKEFVKTGIFTKELSKAFHDAFDLRQEGDYGEIPIITKNDIDEMFPEAKDFVSQIKKYIGLKQKEDISNSLKEDTFTKLLNNKNNNTKKFGR